jgi:hypothetical protein
MTRGSSRTVRLRVDDATVEGRLRRPPDATATVVFVDGGWGVQYAPREQRLAERFAVEGLGTLLVDLVTVDEDRDRSTRVGIERLAGRLRAVLAWLDGQPRATGQRVGLLGVGTGAATVLSVARDAESAVDAAVTIDGRFGPVETTLADVRVPTLFLIDRGSGELRQHNRTVRERLSGDRHRCHALASEGRDVTTSTARLTALAESWYGVHLGTDERVERSVSPASGRPGARSGRRGR